MIPALTPELTRAGGDVGTLLNQLEAQLSEAFSTCSQLAVAATTFGAGAGLTPRLSQPVVQEIGAAMAAIVEAQSRTLAGHRSAERIGRFIGYGDGMPKPDDAYFTGADGGHLSVVARAA